MTAAIIIFSEFKCLGAIVISLSIILGLSRVIANVHNPIDIIGSIIIAIISITIAKTILSNFSK